MKKILLIAMVTLLVLPIKGQESIVIEDAIPTMPRTTRVCNVYYVGDTVLKKKAYDHYLEQTCLPAHYVFHKGRQMTTSGWVFLGAGSACVISSVPLLLSTATYLSPALRIAFGLPSPTSVEAIVSFRQGFWIAVAGAASVVGGITLISLGYDRQHGAVNIYNACTTPKAPTFWTLTAVDNGIGIAYNF